MQALRDFMPRQILGEIFSHSFFCQHHEVVLDRLDFGGHRRRREILGGGAE
jgi:hypothetical protein